MTELSHILQSLVAFFMTLGLWVVGVGIISIFKTNKDGYLCNKTYIFNTPKHVKTIIIGPQDNGKDVTFSVPGAPIGSKIKLYFRCIDGGANVNRGWNIDRSDECFVSGCYRETDFYYIQDKNKKCSFGVVCDQNCSPSRVEITMLQWTGV